ncbi:MAG: carbamoyl-phosphate synthase large subunit, partial [Firmicutes bacterium]|nr:carbamoyl-phosphate synthase large subunit [Bacillota bacterium]
MPKRDDLQKILLIGSGPIVIGQACEFDYSGTQACRALHEEGFEVVLINSNPATIMTDPDMADHTYIEPLTAEVAARIIAREKPDALLPSLGGQTALNLTVDLHDRGILEKHNVELIGISVETIKLAEDRELFKSAMTEAGLDTITSAHVNSIEGAETFAEKAGYPLVIRPSFTLGGTGGGIAHDLEELREKVSYGLYISPVSQVLVEEGIIGWKEIEMEIVRDRNDNSIVVCSIENIDAMGVHTGESITVAPVQTLTGKQYRLLREASVAALKKLGVDTGGCNIQFALDPGGERMVVIEMNPRLSRSSALASKATGFPIAKITAKLAVGYTLDELPNDITRQTPASFEPSLDYCAVKFPRWDFEKFPESDRTLTTQMKSVGEVMGIGRTFKEALQKTIRSLEQDFYGLDLKDNAPVDDGTIRYFLATPQPERLFYIAEAYRRGFPDKLIADLTRIDRWFLDQIEELVGQEKDLARGGLSGLTPPLIQAAKENGFSDRRIATLVNTDEETIRSRRLEAEIRPSFRRVDTCAGEFEALTPYFYSTYERHDETPASRSRRVMILGSGPNRIGQGVEFDYCCVQAAFALRKE